MRQKQETRQLSPVQMWVEEENTQPRPPLAGQAFQAFLTQHDLSILDVALAAGVRLLTVWNIAHDHPVSYRHAEMVRASLYRLSGVLYRGYIALRQEQAEDSAHEHYMLDQSLRKRRKASYH